MIRPEDAMIADFLEWFRDDEHAASEDYYAETITREHLAGLGREEFIEFFFEFAREGGKIQGGGHRTAGRFRETIERGMTRSGNSCSSPLRTVSTSRTGCPGSRGSRMPNSGHEQWGA